MSIIQFYTRENCQLCEEAHILLQVLQNKYDFHIDLRNIETNETWFEKYHIIIPVIKIKNTVLNCNMIDLDVIEKAIKKELTPK